MRPAAILKRTGFETTSRWSLPWLVPTTAASLALVLMVAVPASAVDFPGPFPGPPPVFFAPGAQPDDDMPEADEFLSPPAAADANLLLKESGESDPALPVALPAGVANAGDVTFNTVNPGREAPASPAVAAAFIVSWGSNSHCHSLVVVGRPTGLERPAYIITFMDKTGQMAVAYRAVAYRDAQGVFHLDSRNAMLAGPMARDPKTGEVQWSPDSMAIFANGAVTTRDDDDSHDRETGIVTCVVTADTAAARYQRLLSLAQVMVEGSL